MSVAIPLAREANGHKGTHAEVQRGTESHLQKQSLSHAYAHTHTTGQTTPYVSVRGIRAVTWRRLQQWMPQKADMCRGGTFRQGTREDVQAHLVACGGLGE